jgi:hypothetical protein
MSRTLSRASIGVVFLLSLCPVASAIDPRWAAELPPKRGEIELNPAAFRPGGNVTIGARFEMMERTPILEDFAAVDVYILKRNNNLSLTEVIALAPLFETHVSLGDEAPGTPIAFDFPKRFPVPRVQDDEEILFLLSNGVVGQGCTFTTDITKKRCAPGHALGLAAYRVVCRRDPTKRPPTKPCRYEPVP